MRRAVPTLVIAALAAVLVITSPLSSARAEPPQYVALGDSYAAGVGTRAYLAKSGTCRRSTHAYAHRIAVARRWRLFFRACSGATTDVVARTQLSGLGAATYVTISVGGNDAGFSRVLTACAKPAWVPGCGVEIDRAQRVIRDDLPGRLGGLFRTIRTRAARARVVVVGYPRLFNGVDCNAGTWFSAGEQRRLNATADQLNGRLRAAAHARGFRFADPTSAFASHAVCARTEWVNGLSRPVVESYHANRAGHADGFQPLVAQQLR